MKCPSGTGFSSSGSLMTSPELEDVHENCSICEDIVDIHAWLNEQYDKILTQLIEEGHESAGP